MEWAYSPLDVKSVEEERRVIRGVATTPEPDRVGDIVDPMGYTYKTPLPLLHQHDTSKPIGWVTLNKATSAGITFEATIAKILEPGPLKDRVDTAWGEIKSGLIRGVSIGFRTLERALLPSGGVHYKKGEIMELSLVTIPAHQSATFQIIKSIDSELRAASGQKQDGDSPGVSGKTGHNPVVNIKPQDKRSSIVNTAEQIKSFKEAMEVKSTRMSAIMDEAGNKGETLNAEQTEEYDKLAAEVKSLDEHLKRLADHEARQAATAKPAIGEKALPSSQSRDPQFHNTVKAAPKLAPGVRFARLAKCKGIAALEHVSAVDVANHFYKDDPAIANILKANVLGGSTIDGNWASALVGDEGSAFADFVEFLRPMTILGKFGNNGVPNLRRVPFRVRLVSQTGGGQGYWVGEGKPKPLTSFDFAGTTLEPLKVANIAVVTMELLRDSSPSADLILRDSLAKALQERLDTDFIDPAKAAVSGVSPASILNGVTAIASTGNTAAAIREDIRLLFASFIAADNPPTSGVWIMSAMTALAISLMQNALGQPEFPAISMTGGTLFGLPVIISEYVPNITGGTYVALVNTSDIYLGDEGGINVDISREASLQMLDNPTNDSVTPTATTMVSMFQTNSIAFRAERTINWARRRASAVAYLSGVNWGEA